MKTTPFRDILSRRLFFVNGKGGVGKTAVSKALASYFASQGKSTLHVSFEDPSYPQGDLRNTAPRLKELNADPALCFEEYIQLKLGGGALTRLFTQNKLIRYLAKAAPGLKELVLLGKVWHESENHDRTIVDMPSTGHGIAMFQSTENFAHLFTGGPIQNDAKAMLQTFHDPEFTAHLIIALPEEMPLVEGLELDSELGRFFPENPSCFIVNKCFPKAFHGSHNGTNDGPQSLAEPPDQWKTPVPSSAIDYARKRSLLEEFNLRIWEEKNIRYSQLPYLPPPLKSGTEASVMEVSKLLAMYLEELSRSDSPHHALEREEIR